MNKIPYVVFTENPPLKTKGHGFSVLLYQIISENKSSFASVITFKESADLTVSDLDEVNLNVNCIDFTLLNKSIKNYKLRYILCLFKFIIKVPYLIKHLKKYPKSPLLVCIGTSSRIILYTWILEILIKNPIHIYLVDDIIEINNLIKNKWDMNIAKNIMPRLLKSSERIFTISEGLKNSLNPKIQQKTKTILPVYVKKSTIETSRENDSNYNALKVLFSGGLSILYNDSIQLFDHFLNNFNKIHGTNHKLIIQTYSPKTKYDELNLSSCSSYRTSKLRSDVEIILAEADVFLIPYSFSQQSFKIVATSFPQKIAQLIQYNKPLYFFLPEYSSVGIFCIQNNLSTLCLSNKFEEFEKSFSEMISNKLKVDYSDVYNSHFSPLVAAKIFNDL